MPAISNILRCRAMTGLLKLQRQHVSPAGSHAGTVTLQAWTHGSRLMFLPACRATVCTAAQAWHQKRQRQSLQYAPPSLRCCPTRRAPPSAPAPKRATDRTAAAARVGARGAAARGSPPRPGPQPQAARVRLGHPPAPTPTLASGAARGRACSCRPGWVSGSLRSGHRALLTLGPARCSWWGTMEPCRAPCAAARRATCWCALLIPCSMLGQNAQHVAEHVLPAWQAGCALSLPCCRGRHWCAGLHA